MHNPSAKESPCAARCCWLWGAGAALLLALALLGADSPPPPSRLRAARGGAGVRPATVVAGVLAVAAAGAQGTIGPDLAQSLKGMPAAYIRESILAPGAVTAAGFGPGMMPEDYARRIAPRDLQELIAFIRSGVRD